MKKTFVAPSLKLEATLAALTLGAPCLSACNGAGIGT